MCLFGANSLCKIRNVNTLQPILLFLINISYLKLLISLSFSSQPSRADYRSQLNLWNFSYIVTYKYLNLYFKLFKCDKMLSNPNLSYDQDISLRYLDSVIALTMRSQWGKLVLVPTELCYSNLWLKRRCRSSGGQSRCV